ncbi:hypothetical protein [Streptomyces griseocarneus]|uniref:Uncharacterized protein n=1 Tax=Streptomyces griseocarneus TaxID=51201 RepID=A0ABX7RIC3_9ACTN|nr:hypothetical protein [Streptomyces griseocarneus]QSY47103.1 hypothetical protein J3S04_17090 [Streptomyces griseocarneus]
MSFGQAGPYGPPGESQPSTPPWGPPPPPAQPAAPGAHQGPHRPRPGRPRRLKGRSSPSSRSRPLRPRPPRPLRSPHPHPHPHPHRSLPPRRRAGRPLPPWQPQQPAPGHAPDPRSAWGQPQPQPQPQPAQQPQPHPQAAAQPPHQPQPHPQPQPPVFGGGTPHQIPGAGGQAPDWNHLADSTAARGRRRKVLMIGGGVLAAAALAAVVATAVVMSDKGDKSKSVADKRPSASGSPEPTFSPVAPPNPREFIASQDKDKAPLTTKTLFPHSRPSLDKRVYKRVDTATTDDCDTAAQNGLGQVLKDSGCRKVLRATYVRDGVAVTVGVAVFDDKAAADKAKAKSTGNIESLTGGDAPDFCRNTACRLTANAEGRYAYFTVAGYTNGEAVPSDDTKALQAGRDVSGYTFRRIMARANAQAAASGKPSAAASTKPSQPASPSGSPSGSASPRRRRADRPATDRPATPPPRRRRRHPPPRLGEVRAGGRHDRRPAGPDRSLHLRDLRGHQPLRDLHAPGIGQIGGEEHRQGAPAAHDRDQARRPLGRVDQPVRHGLVAERRRAQDPNRLEPLWLALARRHPEAVRALRRGLAQLAQRPARAVALVGGDPDRAQQPLGAPAPAGAANVSTTDATGAGCGCEPSATTSGRQASRSVSGRPCPAVAAEPRSITRPGTSPAPAPHARAGRPPGPPPPVARPCPRRSRHSRHRPPRRARRPDSRPPAPAPRPWRHPPPPTASALFPASQHPPRRSSSHLLAT